MRRFCLEEGSVNCSVTVLLYSLQFVLLLGYELLIVRGPPPERRVLRCTGSGSRQDAERVRDASVDEEASF